MERLREIYRSYKSSGLIEKAEHLLNGLDDTLRFNCDDCNNNVFEHECLVEGTVVEKLKHCRDILIEASTDTYIKSAIDVALFLARNSEKLSDIRDVYTFDVIDNPPSTSASLPDIFTIDDSSDDERTPIHLPSTPSYAVDPTQKSKFGKILSSKRGKARKKLFVKPAQSFSTLGHKLRQLKLEYHELSLNEDFISSNSNAREKQAIALVISRLNQSEDLHMYIEQTTVVKDPLKIEFEKKEAELKLELQKSQKSMEDVITCPVCIERQKSKTLVPCGHSYCLPCSKKLSKYGKKCAICRGEFDQIIPMFC